MAAIPVRKFPFICKVVLFYGNSLKAVLFITGSFQKLKHIFSMNGRCQPSVRHKNLGIYYTGLFLILQFTTFNKFNKSAHVK